MSWWKTVIFHDVRYSIEFSNVIHMTATVIVFYLALLKSLKSKHKYIFPHILSGTHITLVCERVNKPWFECKIIYYLKNIANYRRFIFYRRLKYRKNLWYYHYHKMCYRKIYWTISIAKSCDSDGIGVPAVISLTHTGRWVKFKVIP